jgi:hypothetical protein
MAASPIRGTAQQLANAFTDFLRGLPPNSGTVNDPVFGFVGAERLGEIVVWPGRRVGG